MHPLVDELAAAGLLRLRSPFPVVADPASVPVARTQVHEFAVSSRVNFSSELGQCRMKPVIESNLDLPAGCIGGANQSVDLLRAEAAGLLDEDVRAGRKGLQGQRCELIVCSRNHDDVGLQREQFLHVGADSTPMQSD